MAAEVTLSIRLFDEMKELKKDFRGTIQRKVIDEIVGQTREHNYHLRMEKSLSFLNQLLREKMNGLRETLGIDLSRQNERIEEIITLLDLVKKWGFEIRLEEAQNLLKEMLDKCVEDLEKCWWGGGEGKPFHPSFISLAQKLGFNIDKYLKMTGPSSSPNQS